LRGEEGKLGTQGQANEDKLGTSRKYTYRKVRGGGLGARKSSVHQG